MVARSKNMLAILLATILASSLGVQYLEEPSRLAAANSEVEFDALSCNDVRTSAAYSGRKFCQMEQIQKEYGLNDRSPAGMYSVLQETQVQQLPGIQCEKKVSSISAVCGAFSHSKLITPMDILAPTKVSIQDCLDISKTNFLITEDQRSLPASLGTNIIYKYIEAGSVTMSESNAACEGGELRLQGKRHENIIRLVTVSFTIRKVELYLERGILKNEKETFPRICSMGGGCVLDSATLIYDASLVPSCSYELIRVSEFESITIEGKLHFINDEHKLLFEVKESVSSPTVCRLGSNPRKTNFDKLLLYPGDLTNTLQFMDAGTIDLELETRVTDFYLAQWSLTTAKETEVKWRSEFCQLATEKLQNDQTLLHGDHILKMQGEVINEHPCRKIRVRNRIGRGTGEDGCLDHLPVYLPTEELIYMAPITRILVPRSAVSIVNCSSHYPRIYEDVEGRLITANPMIQQVTIPLTEHHFLNTSARNHQEVFKFSSLLYTRDEIESYESMLRGHAGERAATKKFAAFYCQSTGECSPSRDPNQFHWDKLLNPMELIDEWWETIKDRLVIWGVAWGILDSIFTLLHFIYKCVLICKSMGKRELTKGAIFRLIFLPGQEIVKMFPEQAEPRRRESRHRVRSNIERGEYIELYPLNNPPPLPAPRETQGRIRSETQDSLQEERVIEIEETPLREAPHLPRMHS